MALPPLRNKKDLAITTAVFSAALLARFYLLFTHRYPMMIHEQDAIGYMDVAENIRSFHPFFNEIRPPAYPFVIALFSLLPLDLELAARIGSMFMDALIVIPLYCLGSIFLSRSGAATAAFLWGFFSFSLFFSISPLSQSTFLFFLCCGILFFAQGTAAEGWRPRYLFIAGVLFALSYLARPEGVVPFGFACAVSFFLPLVIKKDRARKFVGAISLTMGFLVTAGPYLLFLRSRLGYWGVTGKSDMAVKTADTLLTLDKNGYLPRASRGIEAWKSFYGDMGTFLNESMANIVEFAKVFYLTFPVWVHVLAAIGAIFLVARKKWNLLFCLFLLVITTLPAYIVNIPKTHSYLYTVFPVSLLLFAVFWDEVRGFLQGTLIKRLHQPWNGVIPKVVTAIAFAPSLLLSIILFIQARVALEAPGHVREALLTEKIYQECGRFIRNVSLPTDKIMTRWGLIGYFAGRQVVTLPKGGVQEVIDFGRKNGVRYLIIDTSSVLSRRPELMELLEPLVGRKTRKEYGIEQLSWNYYQNLGGYVIYRYVH